MRAADESSPAGAGGHVDRRDLGLLLLRAAGLFLFATFGWRKLTGYAGILASGQSLSTTGLTPLIRALRVPAPAFAGVFVVLCESVGAFLVGVGLATRAAAACLVLSMTGAFYASLRLHEDPLRALLYDAIFLALVLAGAGAYSVDRRIRRLEVKRVGIDLGLLVVRAGIACSTALLLVLPENAAPAIFPAAMNRIGLAVLLLATALVAVGLIARQAAAALALFWLFAFASAFRSGLSFDVIPTRDVLFFFAFLAIAAAGPGRISVEGARGYPVVTAPK